MEYIVSIKYNKSAGEYAIKRRDTVTGENSITYANRLTNAEKIFAKTCGEPYEDKFSVQWVRR